MLLLKFRHHFVDVDCFSGRRSLLTTIRLREASWILAPHRLNARHIIVRQGWLQAASRTLIARVYKSIRTRCFSSSCFHWPNPRVSSQENSSSFRLCDWSIVSFSAKCLLRIGNATQTTPAGKDTGCFMTGRGQLPDTSAIS